MRILHFTVLAMIFAIAYPMFLMYTKTEKTCMDATVYLHDTAGSSDPADRSRQDQMLGECAANAKAGATYGDAVARGLNLSK
ncbi:hypothetical protein [Burkholderia cenocepacia]|uniref:hypothetical protein n=1 Tax=Burkholderia cenocepacia TaxID=95486 RepID=UPI0011B4D9BF|nr:hypothetical protein [Burkholderia cenocepacia]MDN7545059.1 hypothetical protein [Burkholderia cenocepacia]